MIDSPYLVSPGPRLNLADIKTNSTGAYKSKSDGEKANKKSLGKLKELQERLYADGRQALLVILQAMDAGGKDGTIEHVFSSVNPQGCSVTSFKVPSSLEKSHDYLWRIHAACPAKGMIGIFNRSQYESVLVERLHNMVPEVVWQQRYEQINQFEAMLASEGTTIVKFFLHISKDEQAQRLQDRLDEKNKHWKFNPADLEERDRWDEYQSAFEDLLERCSTTVAPWYIVPADRKWYRNCVISDILVQTLERMNLKYPPAVEGIEKYKIK